MSHATHTEIDLSRVGYIEITPDQPTVFHYIDGAKDQIDGVEGPVPKWTKRLAFVAAGIDLAAQGRFLGFTRYEVKPALDPASPDWMDINANVPTGTQYLVNRSFIMDVIPPGNNIGFAKPGDKAGYTVVLKDGTRIADVLMYADDAIDYFANGGRPVYPTQRL